MSEIVSFLELYQAYKSCKKNKATSINSIKFEADLTSNLWKLHYLINNKKYRPHRYICFLAHSPKVREVFASDYSDRVIHHLLVNDLEPIFEPKFIFDSYSCRKNRGIHLAVERTQNFSRKEKNRFYLQLDIKNFFLSINKNILFSFIKKEISKIKNIEIKERILYLSQVIIYDNPTKNFLFKGSKKAYFQLPKHKSLFYAPEDQGLPIGNLTSQFFANVYMNSFDNWIKRDLKTKYYLRYVDDFVLFGETKEELLNKKIEIENYLKFNIKLELKADIKLKKFEDGINFLGYIIRPNYKLVRKRVVNNFKYKLAHFLENDNLTPEDIASFQNIQASYFGHFQHANSFQLREKYNKIINEKLKILGVEK